MKTSIEYIENNPGKFFFQQSSDTDITYVIIMEENVNSYQTPFSSQINKKTFRKQH